MSREKILEILKYYKIKNADKYGIIDLGIFGSIARGMDDSESDIDIVIRTKTPNPFYIVHIKEELEDLFHRSVDIIRMRERMNSYLKENIERDGIYI